MLQFIEIDGGKRFRIQRYHGQDFDEEKWAITFVFIQPTRGPIFTEVFLLGSDPKTHELLTHELIEYLKYREVNWLKIRTVWIKSSADVYNTRLDIDEVDSQLR